MLAFETQGHDDPTTSHIIPSNNCENITTFSRPHKSTKPVFLNSKRGIVAKQLPPLHRDHARLRVWNIFQTTDSVLYSSRRGYTT